MKNKFNWIFAIAVIALLVGWKMRASTNTKSAAPVTARDVLAGSREFEGNQTAAYSLVEFGDYQCPPCRKAQSVLKQTLKENSSDLKFAFRNLPLGNLHPLAYQAALAAEACRIQGKFWQMHDLLMDGAIDWLSITKTAKKLGIQMANFQKDCDGAAKETVNQDLADAEKLGINGTPTFILCSPDGTAARVDPSQFSGIKPYLAGKLKRTVPSDK